MDLANFSNLQLDAMREVGNIGAGNAATALSIMLARPVDMDVPKAELVSIYELAEYYGDPLTMVSAVFVRSEGEFTCSLIFIQEEDESRKLVDLLIGQQMGGMDPASVPAEMRDSALTEVGNIILSSFLNAINVLIGGTHSISVPGVAHDMLGSILDVVASIFGQSGEHALIVDTSLKVENVEEGVSGKVVMLPDPGSLEILLGKLQVL
ncbi:CheY-P phosphatase CheC [bioreactor metagenome]|jgi:chemotaxis protein CheC|uniref:CheY-P phosphatase CheC n=1 Tax=bioreactor metagenome TaxID=1076179 RepID=A0A644WF52_9ZZZZ|nr:chemotaxis protein CheC [Aminivibrio sp.]MDD3515999.1 chemotaxis protein CheC [Synergistaceae bacterium]NCB14649.1 chemotaxis protein CheC [Synergistales bacterium]MEA4951974.1 chemotaxis protein CheC [Aminivibrio sp.]HPF85332.1 chemotaxis protein CheC [Aminivibrio sp.]HRX25258.1 chemotaxis protein CheC [Aminivibrio sp.]